MAPGVRSCDRVAEGAPLLREYVGKTCIEGSNPSGSANALNFQPEEALPVMRYQAVPLASTSAMASPRCTR
jgi:hypothetical protein